MLVALPASIAFGVAVFAPFGPAAAGQGALAGMLGATAIGIVAPLFGGTDRLISAPCAPAAAVMAAFALQATTSAGGASPERVVTLMALVALLSGGLQLLFGAVGGGTLIKYIPWPVVTGYLSGVGIVILLKQLPGLFGLPRGTHLLAGLRSPGLWQGPGLVVGLVTIVVMVLAPRLTKAVPAAILGLAAGVATYFGLALTRPGMLSLQGNAMVIGPIGGTGESAFSLIGARWAGILAVKPADLALLLVPALTLAVLLSIDTLKTCLVVDSLTRSRHDSNREMLGQGLANVASALVGGIPGAGTSGATLVNLASGGKTRLSSVLEGVFALVAFLALGRFVAWAPIAALSGILIVVAFRMLDRSSLRLLRQRSTLLDFVVVATVVAVAVSVDLITASGVGVALAIVLFIRDQAKSSVIRRKTFGSQVFSRQRRQPEEMAILERKGATTVVCELDGNLFFGTTDQLFTALQDDLKTCRFLILDLKLVRSVDLTAVHVLQQIEARLKERDAQLIFTNVLEVLPSGQRLRAYLEEAGLVRTGSRIRLFDELSDALEWTEDILVAEEGYGHHADEPPLGLREMSSLKGIKEERLAELETFVVERSCAAGERIFSQGDAGDEIYFIRRGRVKIVLPIEGGRAHHLATSTRGDFFGDVAFLDAGTRSAHAVADTPTDLYVLSRARFDALSEEHPRMGRTVFFALARTLAARLRRADGEIRALEGP